VKNCYNLFSFVTESHFVTVVISIIFGHKKAPASWGDRSFLLKRRN